MRPVLKKYATSKRGETSRKDRVAENIRRILSEEFREGTLYLGVDDSLSITVCRVDVTPDLRHAKVYVSPLGGAPSENFEALMNENAARCSAVLAKKMPMKYTPKIVFKADYSFDNAAKVQSILHHVQKDEYVPE